MPCGPRMTTDSKRPVNLTTSPKKKKDPPYKTWQKKPSTMQDTTVEATRNVYLELEESFARDSSQQCVMGSRTGRRRSFTDCQ